MDVDFTKQLIKLSNIPAEKKVKEIKLLCKILKNIIEYPKDKKYRDLNCNKIVNKFKSCEPCLHLLFRAGFYKYTIGSSLRLIFDETKFDKLLLIHKILTSLNKPSDPFSNATNKQQSKLNICSKTRSAYVSNNIIDFFGWETSGHGVFNSEYLLSNANIHQNITLLHHDLNECLCMDVISDVMRKYHAYINEAKSHDDQGIVDSIYSKIGNSYSIIDVLDDFNHLLIHHSSQFEDIYNILCATVYDNTPCCLSQCLLMNRHYRDRAQMTQNENLLHELYFDGDDMAHQQLLDRMHCYLFHTFDIGHKITANERKSIVDDHDETKVTDNNMCNNNYDKNIAQITKILNTKNRTFRTNNAKITKFTTEQREVELDEYSYGYRMFYWSYYKGNQHSRDKSYWMYPIGPAPKANPAATLGDWYISPKYKNLKHELINNEICAVGIEQYTSLIVKAAIHSKSNQVRQIFCPRTQKIKVQAFQASIFYDSNSSESGSAVYYEMKEGQSMGKDHITWILFFNLVHRSGKFYL